MSRQVKGKKKCIEPQILCPRQKHYKRLKYIVEFVILDNKTRKQKG